MTGFWEVLTQDWIQWTQENDSKMKIAGEERTLHRMAKVHDILETWQGSQHLPATQNESCTQNKQMTAVWCISDTEVIVTASWSPFQNYSAAAFKLSERSPTPPALSANDLAGRQTQIFIVRRIRRRNCFPVESDYDCATESSLDTEDWLNWNGDLDNPNNSKDDCVADGESDIKQANSIADPEWSEEWDVIAALNVPTFIRSTRKSRRQAEKMLVTVNAIETRRNTWVNTNLERMCQCFTSFNMYLDQEFYVEIYYSGMVSSSLWISVDNQMYSRRNKAFGKIYQF